MSEQVDRKNFVRIQLGVPQLRAIFPEGSEFEASLTKGVVENYARSIADRVTNRINRQREETIASVMREMESKSWTGERPCLSAAAKEAISLQAKNFLKEEIALEVKREFTREKILTETKAAVLRMTKEWTNGFNIRDHVRDEIKEVIKEEVKKISLKDLLS